MTATAASVDTTRDLLAGVLETYLSQTSNRMNRVMKQLSIGATVALPLWLKHRQWL